MITDLLGATATATTVVTVAGVNQAPVAITDSYGTTEDVPLIVAAPGLLANDTDGDGDALTAGSASSPANGTVALNGDGSFTYTPDPDFTGTDAFTYAASDGYGGTATATVDVAVAAVNDAPVAGTDSFTTDDGCRR